MSDRKRFVFTLWLTSCLSLLACVLVAPLRTSEFDGVSSRPDGLRLKNALPPFQPTACLSAAMDDDAVPQEDACPSEDEEQDRAVASNEPRVAFLIPCSFRKVPDRQWIAPRSILSLYPLRC